MTLTAISERLAVELSLPVLTTEVSPDWGSNPKFLTMRGEPSTNSAGAVVQKKFNNIFDAVIKSVKTSLLESVFK